MSQSKPSVCHEFFELDPETQRNLVPKIVSLYVHDRLQKGDIDSALRVLYFAKQKGYTNEYIDKLYDQVMALFTINSYLQSTAVTLNNLDKVPADAIRNLRTRFEAEYNKVKNIIPPELREQVEKALSLLKDAEEFVRFYHEAIPTINEAREVMQKYNELVERAKDSGNPDLIENAFGFAVENFPRIISKLESLMKRDIVLHDERFRQMRDKIRDRIIEVRDTLKALYEFAKHGLPIIGRLQALAKDLEQYGEGLNNLAHPAYRNTLIDHISEILMHLKPLYEMFKLTVYPSEIRWAVRHFADAVFHHLNALKRDLGYGDPRFIDLFEEAEKKAGFELKDYQKPPQPIPGFEEFVKNVVENAFNTFRSDNLLLKALGTIAIVGAGALDNLTLLLRPQALKEQVDALIEMLKGTQQAWNEKQFLGLIEAGQKLFDAMFGSAERTLYTIGGILSALLIAKLVGKLPFPTKLKAVLTDLLQADPVGLAISSAEALGITSVLKQLIFKPVGKAFISLGSIDTSAITKTLRESVEQAVAKQSVKFSKILKRHLARAIRKGVDISPVSKTLTDAVRKFGLGELTKAYSKLQDFYQKWFQIRKDIADILSKEANARIYTKLDLDELLERSPMLKLARDLAEFRESLTEIRKILDKYGELIPTEQRAKLQSLLNNMELLMEQGNLKALQDIFKEYQKFVYSKANFDVVRKQLVDYLHNIRKQVRLDVSDITKMLQEAKTPVDLIKTLDDLGKQILKGFSYEHFILLNLAEQFARLFKESPLGEVFEKLKNRIVKDVEAKIKNIPDLKLNEAILKALKQVDMTKLDKAVRSTLEELYDKARKGQVTLNDLDTFIDNIVKYMQEGLVEFTAVRNVIDTITQHLQTLRRVAPSEIQVMIDTYLRKLGEIGEIRRIRETFPTGETVEVKEALYLNPIRLNFETTMRMLSDYLNELNPRKAKALRELTEKIIEEAKAGKVSQETLTQLFKELSNIDYRKLGIGIVDRIKWSLKSYIDWLERSGAVKPDALPSLKRMADIIMHDLEHMKKTMLKEGNWGIIYAKVGEMEVKLPMLADPSAIRAFTELIEEHPSVTRKVKIGNIEVEGTRRAYIAPDGTFIIEYELKFPENKVLKIARVTRPITGITLDDIRKILEGDPNTIRKILSSREARLDFYYRVYFDPEVETILRQSPEALSELLSGEAFHKFDPMFEVFDKIVVVPEGSTLANAMRTALWNASYIIWTKGAKYFVPVINSILTSARKLREKEIIKAKATTRETIFEEMTLPEALNLVLNHIIEIMEKMKYKP
ncbi:hypothetical protein J7L13_01300, partial [bacterium]|nr:hypothetical protein [bacterium]